ncbi:SDR family NAD(P)-dependent oxidoreductase [Chromobacterium violaceum]|uniref:SDR family NAD(P)-dependent oxidoreductase n=1 Tax=Chromobacterium violaceum TaxID=536 RepID=UPI0009DA8238|nr:SDR family NAD(P)-dependent oxidoreductase [Chromobacterium violaceum]OQS45990.1 short-chain dehydrogenase [Chromobacterium violaceum]OQS47958.1 short-chain dehydrogenase [Chromobacterium violaceum]QRO33690.1 SDR family NAD(P)-dependent oxidoreductase [Chromobacterium violaceum]QRQ16506.1 SDR family NAD(P)-dependent oxidoreductase [Chromobacterium violaceum]
MTETVRTILITGCSSGIGYHTAKWFREKGWRVFASCRRQEDVERLLAEGFESLRLDVDDAASIRAALDEVLARTGGRLDALFNNAGFGQPGAVEDISRQAMREQFETNLFGPWELSNAVMKTMRAQGHGRIVYNSSILGFAAMRWRGAYNASKFAMEGLCDTLRHELRGTDIHVSLVEPGPIESRFRPNALAKFLKNVDIDGSVHRDNYQQQLERLKKEGHAAPFTLPATAVAEAVWRAVTSRRPRARYRVTFPTKLFWFLRRVLPQRWYDGACRAAT